MTDLAKAYFCRLSGDKSYDWAIDRCDEIFFESGEKGWELILSLIEAVPSKTFLAYVAAGYLEVLIRDCGTDFIDRIKDEADHNKKLLYALPLIYLDPNNPVYPKYSAILKRELEPLSEEEFEDLPDLPEDEPVRLFD